MNKKNFSFEKMLMDVGFATSAKQAKIFLAIIALVFIAVSAYVSFYPLTEGRLFIYADAPLELRLQP